MAGKSLPARPRIRWALVLVAALAGCSDEGAQLSLEEARKCAADEYEGHPGTFSQRGNAIAYSYESPNGPANVIVTFDGGRRPVSTFFESAPYGSHQELMGCLSGDKELRRLWSQSATNVAVSEARRSMLRRPSSTILEQRRRTKWADQDCSCGVSANWRVARRWARLHTGIT